MWTNYKRMIFRIWCFILLVTILTVSGCSTETKKNGSNKINPQNILDEYLESIGESEKHIREFGTLSKKIETTQELIVGINYPMTNYDALNSEIKDWISSKIDECKKEAVENADSSSAAELTISYNSFYTTDSFACVKMRGVFKAPHLEQPVDILKTFNVDTKGKKLLNIDEVFSGVGQKVFNSIFASDAGIVAEKIDENISDCFVLSETGIDFLLPRGAYLPVSEGTKTISYQYADINHLLNDSFILKKQQVLPDDGKQSTSQHKKMIALTFDDGPSAYTEKLLDIFVKNGGKGTFFVIGNQLDKRAPVLKRMKNEGHEIASHSWDHSRLTSLSPQDIKDQIMTTRSKIREITGSDALILRPPYGAYDDVVRNVGIETGVSFVTWSVDTLDWKTKDVVAIYNESMASSNDGAIVLCHDLYESTIDAMSVVVPKLIADGYELVTVSELLSHSSGGIEPGKVYRNR